MSQEPAAGRKSDPFEDLLLEQARACHAELTKSIANRRLWEQECVDNKLKYYEMMDLCKAELGNVSQLVADTATLAGMAARLRGQNIRVVRTAERGEGVPENRNSIPQENVVNDAEPAKAAE